MVRRIIAIALVGIVLGVSLFLWSTKAAGPLTFSTIDFPGSSFTAAVGINNAGQVVGVYTNSSGTHGFLLNNGTFSTIDFPGSTSSQVRGINDAGQMVGGYNTSGGPSSTGNHGFLLSGGNFSSFDFPGSLDTIAYGLNNVGQIVGTYLGSVAGDRHGFLLSSGNFTTIDFPGSNSGFAEGINDSGQIVGVDTGVLGLVFGFVDSAGSFDEIQFPGSLYTDARAVNNLGDIVGQDGGFPSGSPIHGFLLSRGNFSLIDFPGVPFQQVALGINDHGQVVGGYTDSSGHTHGYFATPCTLAIQSLAANPSILWPPNHKLVAVNVAASASDSCDAAPSCRIVSVTSNEPINGPGDGNTQPDWIITGNLTVQLRAERAGSATDRVYTVTVKCTDTSGNSSMKSVNVTVPHDQSR